jgi:AcrR family transcriptional regulator
VYRISLREITRASGARNSVALQYHFTDRAGLIRAIVGKHFRDIDRDRHQLLDALGVATPTDIRDLSAALVVPAANKLTDGDGGLEYLQIQAELVNRPRSVAPLSIDMESSIERWRVMVDPYLDREATRLHRRFTAIRFAYMELGRRAQSGPHTDDRLFTSHLVDLVTAMLQAPVSSETSSLAATRDAAVGVAPES